MSTLSPGTQPDALFEHIERRLRQEVFRCTYCGTGFDKDRDRIEHQGVVHEGLPDRDWDWTGGLRRRGESNKGGE